MIDSEFEMTLPCRPRHRRLSGLAATARAVFVPERRGNPLGAFPTLSLGGGPYNFWLTERIIKPVLMRWSRRGRDRRAVIETVMDAIDWASGRSRLAFQEILPSAAILGGPAILAATGVTANLQRTLTLLGEFMLDERPPAGTATFELSRNWCGLVDYPADAPCFSAPIHRPGHPGRLRPDRCDPGHLRNALWCSSREIEARCAEAIAVLREEIHRAGLFTPDDLRHLHPHSAPRETAPREGAGLTARA